MNREIQPGMEANSPRLSSRSFFCCCPIILPLLPFFALRWMVLRATGKLEK